MNSSKSSKNITIYLYLAFTLIGIIDFIFSITYFCLYFYGGMSSIILGILIFVGRAWDGMPFGSILGATLSLISLVSLIVTSILKIKCNKSMPFIVLVISNVVVSSLILLYYGIKLDGNNELLVISGVQIVTQLTFVYFLIKSRTRKHPNDLS